MAKSVAASVSAAFDPHSGQTSFMIAISTSERDRARNFFVYSVAASGVLIVRQLLQNEHA